MMVTAEYQIYHSDSHTSWYQDIVQIGFDNTPYYIHTADSMFYVIVTTESFHTDCTIWNHLSKTVSFAFSI